MKDHCLNPTYMNKIFISGLLVIFWFDKNIFDLHGTLFFSDFLFYRISTLIWHPPRFSLICLKNAFFSWKFA